MCVQLVVIAKVGKSLDRYKTFYSATMTCHLSLKKIREDMQYPLTYFSWKYALFEVLHTSMILSSRSDTACTIWTKSIFYFYEECDIPLS